MPQEDRKAASALRRAAKATESFFNNPVDRGSITLVEYKKAMKQVNNLNSSVRNKGVKTLRDSRTKGASAMHMYKHRLEEIDYEVCKTTL